MGGGPIGAGGVLAHPVVPLSGRDRAGEIARAPGTGLHRGSAHRRRCATPAGSGRGAQRSMAGGARAAGGAIWPAGGRRRAPRPFSFWRELVGGPWGGEGGGGGGG